MLATCVGRSVLATGGLLAMGGRRWRGAHVTAAAAAERDEASPAGAEGERDDPALAHALPERVRVNVRVRVRVRVEVRVSAACEPRGAQPLEG